MVMVECNLMMDATQVCARFTWHALVVLFPLKFVIISMAIWGNKNGRNGGLTVEKVNKISLKTHMASSDLDSDIYKQCSGCNLNFC